MLHPFLISNNSLVNLLCPDPPSPRPRCYAYLCRIIPNTTILTLMCGVWHAVVMKPCGHVICKTCTDTLVRPANQCIDCDKTLGEKDIIELKREGKPLSNQLDLIESSASWLVALSFGCRTDTIF